MMGKNHHARAAAFFAVANVVAGILHYFFQVWSSSQLSVLEFGELNSWIAYFSVALSLGAFAQYGANFFIASPAVLRMVCWLTLLLSVLSFFAPWHVGQTNGLIAALFGVTMGVTFSWCMGQAQARLAFVVMGLGVLICAIAKFALAGVRFPVDQPSMELAWAVALAYSPALVWMSVVLIIQGSYWPRIEGRGHGFSAGLGASAILSFASVFIPQADIIAIHQTQSPDVIGEFARVSLLYKAVFFGFLILAQWLLPHQLASAETQPQVARWLAGSRWRVLGVGMVSGVVMMSGSLAIGGLIMPGLTDAWVWIVLSCFNMVWLTNLFFSIQLDCVEENLKRAGLTVAALVAEAGFAIYLKMPVTRYLLFAIACNTALWFLVTRAPQALPGGLAQPLKDKAYLSD